MVDIKKIDNEKIFNEMLEKVSFKFPVAEISRKTGYSKGSVSEILKGNRNPTDEFLKKFSESFNVEIPDAKFYKQTKTLHTASDSSENYGLDEEIKKELLGKENPSQKRGDDDITIVYRLTKMLDDAYVEIRSLRQELDRKRNN